MSSLNSKMLKQYKPVLFIFAGITIAVIIWQGIIGSFSMYESKRLFMGMLFLTFGFLKVLNWRAFASEFAKYDIVAKRSSFYAYSYPIIEFALGTAYLLNIAPLLVNAITLALIVIGSIGIIKTVRSGNLVDCVCFGSIIRLPISTFTIIEDVSMGYMVITMLISNI